jgi:hypothetical protein
MTDPVSDTVAVALPTHEQVICTLYEGDFHIGLAALVNSLVRGGFRGLFWVGFRGELPPWTAKLTRREDGLFEVPGEDGGVALLGFETFPKGRHFGQFKPEFMAMNIDRGIAMKYIWYFDPDITVRAPWSFFLRWAKHGIGICQEITMGTMPSNHPIRCEWMELAREAGWGEPVRQQERYFNSGFIGADVAHRAFFTQWMAAVRLANASGVKTDQFQKGDRTQTFFTVDQDTMNIATMYADVPFSTIGPEGMGFIPGGFAMYHSVGSPKPWRKRFLKSAMQGKIPSNGEKHFLHVIEGPLAPYTPGELAKKRRAAKAAVLLGRFYSRD